MTNNERFCQMLNSCQNPRRVYNALMTLAETPTTRREEFLADYRLAWRNRDNGKGGAENENRK